MIQEELEKIIKEKTSENEWLDYKQKWHSNNADLLKDILSFVNTTHNKDCYLIFGLVDKTYEIVGVGEDENRKDTQKVIDMMVSKKLSDIIPKLLVETFEIERMEVDVLTIFDTRKVPLFLTEKYLVGNKTLNCGQIFTRIGDTNTSNDKTADSITVEQLYKKRLYIDTTIYERYLHLIEQTEDWTYIDIEQKILYNFDPNFYILIKDYEDETELVHSGDYYSWLVSSSDFPDEWKIRKYSNVVFMYGMHEIFSVYPLFYFDRDRGVTVSPRFANLTNGKSDFNYNYLINDSLPYKFMILYSQTWSKAIGSDFYHTYYSAKKIFENVVIYETEVEKKELESNFYRENTLDDLEKYFNYKIIPTEENIVELIEKNSEYGRASLLQNNIAKAINVKLEIMRNNKC
jgi:Divergent AAA domain.